MVRTAGRAPASMARSPFGSEESGGRSSIAVTNVYTKECGLLQRNATTISTP
jgi:hypothetical protein